MKPGNVILTPLPQADGAVKNRPAVILCDLPPFGDFLVCGVSTQLRRYTPGFDEIIAPGDADFSQSGLLTTSVIRLGFLAILARKDVIGAIGAISEERHRHLVTTLARHLLASQLPPGTAWR